MKHPRTWLVPLLAAGLLAAGCGTTVVNPVTGRAERTVMDEAAEVAEGRKAHEQVLAEYGALANPRLQAYVDEIGQRLARQSHRPNLKWTFTVLDSPEINAFALPGGYVYVTRGILAYLDNEAEMAGVIGHEIGHVTARHGAQRATRQQSAGIGVFAATVLGVLLEGAGVSGAGQLASDVSQTVAAGLIASYSREQETQADELGAEYLARSRYDPQHMVDVIGVLANQERFAADVARAEGRKPRSGPNWLASHPANDRRLADIKAFAQRYAQSQADDGRARFQQVIDGIVFGDGRAQGVVRGRHFFHEDLGVALTAPAGFAVHNDAGEVALVNPAGDAALVLKLVPAEAGRSHDDIIRNALKPSDGQARRYAINGLSATHFSGSRRDTQGRTQPVEATLVSGPQDRTFALLYVARDAATLGQATPSLREAEGSFRPLSAADRAAARPWTVKLVPYPRGGFAELARGSPLGTHAERQLRLLNGVYSGGEPKPGELVKVVQ